MAEQGEVVPDRLQHVQRFTVLLDLIHVTDAGRELRVNLDAPVENHRLVSLVDRWGADDTQPISATTPRALVSC